MAVAALVVSFLWFVLAFVVRTLVQVRRTGDSGWRASGIAGRIGSTEWWAGAGFIVALLVGLVAPIADLLGFPTVARLDHTAIAVLGTLLAALGVGATVLAQLSMGDAWRIGVDARERTELVTGGAFAIVRNPIFSAMLVTAIGLALMVPNAIAFIGLVTLVGALELQVRGAEEPYLREFHGDAFVAYASRVGRFVPRIGRPTHAVRD